MLKIANYSMSGRATFAALLLTGAVVGGVSLAAHARAQGGGNPMHITKFGPGMLGPDASGEGADHILIGLLLPAVQTTLKMPFRIEVMNHNVDFLLNFTPAKSRRDGFFDVFLTFDREKNLVYLNVLNTMTGDIVKQKVTTGPLAATVRILPAILEDGTFLQPIASSCTARGKRNAQLGDGSVVPMPFEYQIPVVQDEILL